MIKYISQLIKQQAIDSYIFKKKLKDQIFGKKFKLPLHHWNEIKWFFIIQLF
jgi:hypothetical protein